MTGIFRGSGGGTATGNARIVKSISKRRFIGAGPPVDVRRAHPVAALVSTVWSV
jgi:hypothetical protein